MNEFLHTHTHTQKEREKEKMKTERKKEDDDDDDHVDGVRRPKSPVLVRKNSPAAAAAAFF